MFYYELSGIRQVPFPGIVLLLFLPLERFFSFKERNHFFSEVSPLSQPIPHGTFFPSFLRLEVMIVVFFPVRCFLSLAAMVAAIFGFLSSAGSSSSRSFAFPPASLWILIELSRTDPLVQGSFQTLLAILNLFLSIDIVTLSEPFLLLELIHFP